MPQSLLGSREPACSTHHLCERAGGRAAHADDHLQGIEVRRANERAGADEIHPPARRIAGRRNCIEPRRGGSLDRRAGECPGEAGGGQSAFDQKRRVRIAVRSFPPRQIVLLDDKRECEVRFDDVTKILAFPAWQVEALAAAAKPSKEPAIFADAIVPGQDRVRRIQGRSSSSESRCSCVWRHFACMRPSTAVFSP